MTEYQKMVAQMAGQILAEGRVLQKLRDSGVDNVEAMRDAIVGAAVAIAERVCSKVQRDVRG